MARRITIMRWALAGGVSVAALLYGPASLGAQSSDPRWIAWVGCWEATASGLGDTRLCVRPAEGAGAIEVVRLAAGQEVARELVWVDGVRHPSTRGTCQGWEEGRFSADGHRILLRSEHACDDGVTQEGGGIMSMASPEEWLDVRVAGMGGERMAWVQRYRLSPTEVGTPPAFGGTLDQQAWAVRSARFAASAALDVGDIIEASAAVPPEAVRALVGERKDRLELRAQSVAQMADAGVPEDVIDVAIAVSYPERFQVAPSDDAALTALDAGSLRRRPIGGGIYDPFDPVRGLGYGYGYGYGDRFGYGYGDYRYGGYGYGGNYFGYRPIQLIVRPADPTHGRVMNGSGYSRRRGETSGTRANGGSSGGQPAAAQGGGGGSSEPSGGSSSGGSSTGRTAKPRGGG